MSSDLRSGREQLCQQAGPFRGVCQARHPAGPVLDPDEQAAHGEL